jgi:hypothetical protein
MMKERKVKRLMMMMTMMVKMKRRRRKMRIQHLARHHRPRSLM